MRVLALTKYDREAASTRQRMLQYAPLLAAAGIELDYRPLLGNEYVRSLANGQSASRRDIAASYARRLVDVVRRPQADLLWVYAELFPWLPGWFEALIARHDIPIVYDMDDAFFVPYEHHRNAWVRTLLGEKLRPLIENAAACTCGNAYLQDYASRWCQRTVLIPTVVDAERYVPQEKKTDRPVIGWIGSPSTWANVQPLLPLLRQLRSEMGVRIRAVGAGRAAEADRFEGLELVEWSEAGEIAEVQGFDIGIMPLIDAPFQRGKSGYKLIQYMACGLPSVASPVGVNASIVTDETGLIATSLDEWRTALVHLIREPALRTSLGQKARSRALSQYSLQAQAPRLVELFRSITAS